MKPTVLHVLEAFAGGTERHVLDVVRHIDAFEHVVAVPSHHAGGDTAAAAARVVEAGGRIERVAMSRSPLGQPRNVVEVARIRRLARQHRAAIVHGHSSIGGALARLAAVGTGLPVVYTPNGVSRSRAALTAERALGPLTSAWIAVSASEGELARAQRLCRPDRLHVVPNGIDVTPPAPLRPSLRERLSIEPGVPMVGCVGRLARQKAPEVFVEACGSVGRRFPDAVFVLVGGGSDRQRRLVEDTWRASGLGERLRLVDGIPDVAGALGEFDVYALPSRFEGGPYTPLEAMRAGTAVVVSDAAGNRDTVEDGTSGRVVPVGDAVALADAISELLADPGLRARLADAGRRRLHERFDVRAMAADTEKIYRDLLGRAGMGRFAGDGRSD